MDIVNYLVKYLDSNFRIIEPINAYEEIVRKDFKFPDLNIREENFKKMLQFHEGEHLSAFLNSLADEYFKNENPDLKVLGFKGNYLFNVLNISQSIPHARFVVITRDVRGVLNSQKNSIVPEQGSPFSITPYRLAKNWNKANFLIQLYQKELSSRFMEVHYESFINSPKSTLKKIGDFLDLPYRHSHTGNTALYIPDRYQKLHEKVKEKPDPANADKWRKSLSFLEIQFLNYYCYNGLSQKGYLKIGDTQKQISFLMGYLGYLRWVKFPKVKRKLIEFFTFNP